MTDVVTRLRVRLEETEKDLNRYRKLYEDTSNTIIKNQKKQQESQKKIADGIKEEAGIIGRLREDIKRLKIERDVSNSPKSIQGYNKRIKQQEALLKNLTRATEVQSNAIKNQEKRTDNLSRTVKKLGGILAVTFGVRRIIQFTKESVKLFNTQAQAENQLLVALKGRQDVQRALIQQATELQSTTLFGDQETIQAQALIAAFTKEEEQIKALTIATQDFATAKGFDLRAAAELVTKTFASTTNSLTRYGIEVEGAAGSSERLESVTRAINEAFGGQARAAAQVGTGAITQLQNKYGDLREEIGERTVAAINLFLGGVNKQSDAVERERANLNALVSQLILTNEQRGDTSDIINDIQLLYPDFLKNIDTEVISETELRDRLREVNDEYLQRATVLGFQEEIEEAAAKAAALRSKQLKLERSILSRLSSAAAEYGLQEEIVGKTLEEQFEILQKNISTRDKLKGAIFGISDDLGTLTAVTKRASNAEAEYNDILTINTDLINQNGGAIDKNNNSNNESTIILQTTIADLKEANKELNDELLKKSINDEEGIQNVLRQIEANEKLIKQLTTLKALRPFEELQRELLNTIDIALQAVDVIEKELPEAVLISNEIIEQNNREFNQSVAKENEELQKERLKTQTQLIDQSAAAISSFLGDSKEAAIAQVLLNNAVTLAQAASSVKAADPITYVALLTSILGVVGGITQVLRKDVEGVKVPQFAEGTPFIQGAGTGTSDSIHAMVSRGERVVTAKDNKDHWNELEAIRKGDFNQKYIKREVVLNVLKTTQENKDKSFADNLASSLILNNLDDEKLYRISKHTNNANYWLEIIAKSFQQQKKKVR